MNFYKFLRKENNVKESWESEGKKNHPKPRIPIVANLAIRRYAEYPKYISPLQSVKRGEKGAGERGGGGRERPGRERRGEEGERLAMHVGNDRVRPDSKHQCPVKKEII